jgi:hypothetical protein
MRISYLESGMETIRIRVPGWIKVGSGINIPDPRHWINEAKNSKKPRDFLSLKTDVNVPALSTKQKDLGKNLILIGLLKAAEEKGRIRSRILIRTPVLIQVQGPGSVSKRHGSSTLKIKLLFLHFLQKINREGEYFSF